MCEQFARLFQDDPEFIMNCYWTDESNGMTVKNFKLLRARFQGRNFIINITHLSKSSTTISNIWLSPWYDLPLAR